MPASVGFLVSELSNVFRGDFEKPSSTGLPLAMFELFFANWAAELEANYTLILAKPAVSATMKKLRTDHISKVLENVPTDS